jgi:hypothetical protein
MDTINECFDVDAYSDLKWAEIESLAENIYYLQNEELKDEEDKFNSKDYNYIE